MVAQTMSPLIVEKVARALSKFPYNDPEHEVFDCNSCEKDGTQVEFIKMANAAILALKDLPDEYFTRVYDKVVWEGIIERIVDGK